MTRKTEAVQKRTPAGVRKRMAATLVFGGLATVAALGGTARAEGPAEGGLPKEVKDMSCLLGSWKGTGSMTMGGQKADGLKMTWTCRRTSSEWGVSCTALMTGIPGVDRYEETDLFGFEPGTGKYHWFSVTNAGETHDHVSTLVKGETLQFVHTGTQEGKPFKEVIDLTFKGKGKGGGSSMFELRSESFLDGKSVAVLQGSAHK